jgi:hypothetical protein
MLNGGKPKGLKKRLTILGVWDINGHGWDPRIPPRCMRATVFDIPAR